jgi:hypothetical protein
MGFFAVKVTKPSRGGEMMKKKAQLKQEILKIQ